MWFVWEACGIVCAFFTYFTVFTVQIAFIKVGVWEELMHGSMWAILHFLVFNFNVSMIIASHLKCMLTEPGFLPRDYDELDSSKLPHELSIALAQIQNSLMDDEIQEITEDSSQNTTVDSDPKNTNHDSNGGEQFNLNMKTLKKENSKAKEEDKMAYQSIMKKIKASKVESSDDSNKDVQPLNSFVVNARNVRFLDKILSKKCKKCNTIKPPHSHHCSVCRRCIARMDHHCPWVNNCVGFYTQKHFLLFLIYVFNGSAHALYILSKTSLYCLDKNCDVFNSLFNIGLSIELILQLLQLAQLYFQLCSFAYLLLQCSAIRCHASFTIHQQSINFRKLTKRKGRVGGQVGKTLRKCLMEDLALIFGGSFLLIFPSQQLSKGSLNEQIQSLIIKTKFKMEGTEVDLNQALETKLQRLQLSEELEYALEEEFGKLDSDPLLSSKFDVNEYINQQFYDDQSLNNLEEKIQNFDDKISDLDVQIKECIREQAYASEGAREELKKINEESALLIDKIQSVKQKAEVSEEMVQSICSEIRSLDFAKKNITFTITSLKRMIMLITGIEQLRGFCINKQYKEASNLIEATDELCNYFKDYMDVQQIKDLRKERDHLCNQLRLQIFEDFNKIDKGSLQDLLYDACFVIDALGEQAVNEVRNWFCNFILEPYIKLFAPGQPEASFDNTKRRFAWLKRTLKEFQEKYEHIFPSEWNLKPMIAYEFCRQTKLHIDNILSTQHHSIDVSIIIDILQNTIDFEHDLHKRFAANQTQGSQEDNRPVSFDSRGNVKIESGTSDEIKEKYKNLTHNEDQQNKKVYEKIRGKTKMSAHIYRFKGCISECFEPYLKSYSESEERKIIDAVETVIGYGDKLEVIDYTVYSSSLHLFKNIKSSLKRCISFSTSKALFDLHICFKNVFRHYSKLLRRNLPKIGNENDKVNLNEDQELKCCYIINTCEYCLETIPGLHNSIQEKIDEQYKEKVDLNIAQDTFRELINQCITGLISSLEAKAELQYQQGMQKINWAAFSGVQDTSQFFRNICQLLQKRTLAIKEVLNPVYFTYLLNKIASSVPNQYLAQVYKIKKVNDESSQQFLLDLVEMKSTLSNLPLLQTESQQQHQRLKVPESYQNFVNKNILKLEGRFKVLGYPIEQIKDAYATLVKDKSQDDLESILLIRGVKKQDFSQYRLNA